MRRKTGLWLLLAASFLAVVAQLAEPGDRSDDALPLPPLGPADVAAADVGDLAEPYPALLTAFRTPLNGGETGRIENITQAAAYLHGFELGPGGVFSFNDVVGPREERRGFVPAPEIYNGEYVMGIGGGVCQVSSTLYNAALLAGMRITERMHHSRPLSYVPLGRDATVSYGELDLRFENTLPFAVQVRAAVSDGHLEVQLWGQERLPVEVQVETLAAEVIMPELHIVEDPALPTGVEWLADEGLPGWNIEVHRIVRQGEFESREIVSYDVYPPRPQLVRIGP